MTCLLEATKKSLLQKRDLDSPDKRELFRYQIEYDEYTRLQKALTDCFQQSEDVAGVIYSDPVCQSLFVLYASEWWRREYNGSGFSWTPIFKSLKLKSNCLTQSQRSQVVENGLKSWGFSLKESGGLRFLGTIAVQGGLPLRLLGEPKNRIGSVLRNVLQHIEGRDVKDAEIRHFIETQQSTNLPRSYRQDSIYELLAKMVQVVLDLKDKIKLSATKDPVAALDHQDPHWKDRFPLSMQDKRAKQLVEQLVKDAAQIKAPAPGKAFIPVIRYLDSDGEPDRYELRSRVERPDTVDSEHLRRFFSIPDDTCLPRRATLRLMTGSQAREISLIKLAGQTCWRLEGTLPETTGNAACDEHVWQFPLPDGQCWKEPATGGAWLDDELPWIFSDDPPHAFLKAGSGRIRQPQVLVALPERWTCQPEASRDGACEARGMLGNRQVFQVRGTWCLVTADGEQQTLQTGQSASDPELRWHGKRLWLAFRKPGIAFLGQPRLEKRRQSEDGHESWHPMSEQPKLLVTGDPDGSEPFGPVTLQYPHQKPQIRTRMLVLRPEAGLKYEATDAHGGTIVFQNWGLSGACVIEPGPQQIKQHFTSTQTQAQLTVQSTAKETRTPDKLVLELVWAHTSSKVRLALPFPAHGVRGFDGDGQALRSGQSLAIHALAGVRLVLVRDSASSVSCFTLRLEAAGKLIQYDVKIPVQELSVDIAPIDYKETTQNLLDLDDSSDATVKLSMHFRGDEVFCLSMIRYPAAWVEKDTSKLRIHDDSRTPDGAPVLATRLESPQADPVELEPAFLAEGIPTPGWWDFAPEQRERGTWLIYPAQADGLWFRPAVWPLGRADDAGNNPLLEAVAIQDKTCREERMAGVIEAMATDFRHRSWKTLEQWADALGWLPLVTLDLWRMLARSATGMAALALRLSDACPDHFCQRFAQELPFVWETVPRQAWQNAMQQLQAQCDACYPPDQAQAIFQMQLKKVLENLRQKYGALTWLLGVAASAFSEEEKHGVDALLRNANEIVIKKQLFDPKEGQIAHVRRNHANEKWPEGFDALLDQAKADPAIQPWLYLDHLEHWRAGIIQMPLIVAACLVHNRSNAFFGNPERIYLLRLAQAFDPDWFDEACNQTVTRILANEGDDHA